MSITTTKRIRFFFPCITKIFVSFSLSVFAKFNLLCIYFFLFIFNYFFEVLTFLMPLFVTLFKSSHTGDQILHLMPTDWGSHYHD
jgi:hypothetical protein